MPVFALLIALGFWQLQRLDWKQALIARIAARSTAPAEPLPPPNDWARLAPEAYDYRHVRVRGIYENDKEALVFRGAAPGHPDVLGPGYLVLTPLRLVSGGYVIVNRGFVPLDFADAARRSAGELTGEVEITGLMRPPEPRNFFTPPDRPDEGRYFTRDPDMIAAHFGLAEAAPFTIDADDIPLPSRWPQGGATEKSIPNNHLSYALTWFGLAFGLLAVLGSLVFRRRKW